MGPTNNRALEVPLNVESYELADQYIEQWMTQHRISEKSIYETKLLFEALFRDMIEQGVKPDTILTIKPQRAFGEYDIKLGFEGESYIPSLKKDQADPSPEMMIVKAYSDKVGYRYRLGYNRVSIVVKRNYSSSLLSCLIALVVAILISIPMNALLSSGDLAEIDTTYIRPLIKQFANAMLMIGAPVTFFSLIKNLTDIYILSEKSSSARKLQVKTIVTSMIAVLLALITGIVISIAMSSHYGLLGGQGTFENGMTAREFISSLVPSSIFEPFETYMPFPIIIVALLLTYALCSIGEYFDSVHRFINICLEIFSKMVTVVMFTLPFFCFLAVLSLLITDGTSRILILIEYVAVVFLSITAIILFYLVRLLIGKVNIPTFVRHLPTLMWENFKINSAIDAVPFNIRYCSIKYGYSRKRLGEKLPILAQTNQDGNCFLIMLIAMIFIFMLGIDVSWMQIFGIGFLVLFLSVGAPNQPGSIVIGMLIITFYLKADELISIAIFAEVFFGSIQNIINVLGDIVTVAIDEQKHMKKAAA